MKLYFNYILLFITVGLFVACDDDLDIEPEQSLSTDAAFSDENTAVASLMGVYSRSQDLEVFGAMPQVIAEYQADNVNFIGSFPTLQDINLFVTQADNGSIRSIWRDHYRMILAANAVIKNVPNVDDSGFLQEERDQVVAEAKFLRAIGHFQLVNLFGQPYTLDNGASAGVPLILEPFILEGEVVMPMRNSVSEVYDQVERDLAEAVADLPASYSSPDQTRGRATVGAANALLSRVALYKGDWSTAESFADQVIASDLYELAGDYSFYDANTSESIFSVQMTAVDNSRTGSGGWASFFMPAENGARGDAPYSDDLLNSYEEGDLRLEALSTKGENGLTYTTKFPDAINNTDNAPIIRTTEMFLNKAEALVQQSGAVEQEAIDIINQLRTRAGLSSFTSADFSSGSALLDVIYDERRKELAFEGHRRMDLLRRGLSLRADLLQESAPGASRVVLPIPQYEIDLGSSLPQNAGY
ncbi:MAG: RagB/SusD family nutrient uptake outer membrane protein [Bacteroidota bacterium]